MRKAIEDHPDARRHRESARESSREGQGVREPSPTPSIADTTLHGTPRTTPQTTPRTAVPPTDHVTAPGPRWHDLSDARAGAAARERAVAERESQGMVRHVLARLVDAKTDERAWRIGADGEQAVGDQLGRVSHS